MRVTAAGGGGVGERALDVATGGQLTSVVAQADGVLPEGFSLPPLLYSGLLVIGFLTVAALLYAISPPVRNRTVVAFAPWMMIGGVLYALRQTRGLPSAVEPLFGTPAVYVTVAIVTGFVWIAATLYEEMGPHSSDRTLGVVGTALAVTFVVFAIIEAFQAGRLDPLPAVVAIAGAGVAGAFTWIVLSLYFTDSAAVTSLAGVVVVMGHALDGVTTAVGHDMVGTYEQTPLSARILEFGASLPTAEYVGAGWLFLVVKLLLASAIVILFREWVREEPHQGRLVLAVVAAVGLGPGTHNLMVFALGGV